jgi:hypothetical protein
MRPTFPFAMAEWRPKWGGFERRNGLVSIQAFCGGGDARRTFSSYVVFRFGCVCGLRSLAGL